MPLSDYNERKFCFRTPSGVICLHAVQAFERFAFHGIRVMLTMYMVDNFNSYPDHLITAVYHIFNSSMYIFATFGVILGDSRCGKYVTIIIVSIPYLTGYVCLAISAAYTKEKWMKTFFYIALPLLGVGGGILCTCIVSLIVEQYSEDEDYMFCSNYIVLAVCALTRFLSPEICSDVSCSGGDCYMATFIMHLSFAIISVLIFIICGFTYVVLKDEDYALQRTFSIFCYGACRKSCSTTSSKENFLENVISKYSEEETENIKVFWQMPLFYVQLGIFWALCSQHGSTWTLQATQMNCFITSTIGIKASQMQLLFPLFYLVLCPFHQSCIIPLMRKIGLEAAKNQIFVGGVFSALSYLTAWLLQGEIAVSIVGLYAGYETYVPRHYFNGKRHIQLRHISILWQIPQYFLLAVGAVFILTAIFQISYIRLSSSFRKIGTMLCFISMFLGEVIVALIFVITQVDRKTWFLVCAVVQVLSVISFQIVCIFIKLDLINQEIS